MRTAAETSIFVRYASEIWTDSERMEFINWRWKASGPDWQLRMAKLLSESLP
jgi:hypothetical protein